MENRQYMQHRPSYEDDRTNHSPMNFYPMAPTSQSTTSFPSQQQMLPVTFEDPFSPGTINDIPENMIHAIPGVQTVTSPLGVYQSTTQASRPFPSHLPHLHIASSPAQSVSQLGPPVAGPHGGNSLSNFNFAQQGQLAAARQAPEIWLDRSGTDVLDETIPVTARPSRPSITSSITSSPGLLSSSSFSHGESSPSIPSPMLSDNLSPDVNSPGQSRRSTFSSLSRGGSKKNKGRRKRTTNEKLEDEVEHHEGEDEAMEDCGNPVSKRRKAGNTEPSGPSLACPFFQHSRELGTGACYGPGFADWGRVKEHLIRAHSLKDRVYCPRCKSVFDKNSNQLEEHRAAQSDCPLQDNFPPFIIDADKLERIQQIKDRRISSEEKWNRAYKILYPEERVHWAFNDSVSFDSIQAKVTELWEEELKSLEDFGAHQVEPGTVDLLKYKLGKAFERCGRLQGLSTRSSNASEVSLPALQTQQTIRPSNDNQMGGYAATMFPPYADPFDIPASVGMDALGFYPTMDGTTSDQ